MDQAERLIEAAKPLVNLLTSNEEYNVFEYHNVRVDLARVLEAMLHHARGCGGEAGERYTASAILACHDLDNLNTLQNLRKLALTWLCDFLFVFYASSYHPQIENEFPSYVTLPPWCDDTQLDQDQTPRFAFRKKLLLRDGYRCAVTQAPHDLHPVLSKNPGPALLLHALNSPHIMFRAIGVDQEVSASVMVILRNYAGLSEEELTSLRENIDDPSNGLILGLSLDWRFNKFLVCLQETNTPNRYTFKSYHPGRILGVDPSAVITVDFKDHSAEFAGGRSRGGEIPLPNPHYLRIHASIAGILHMSGASDFLNGLLKEIQRHDDISAVHSWEEFDKIVKAVEFREMFVDITDSLATQSLSTPR